MKNETELEQYVIVPAKRHISLGDYCNAETSMYATAGRSLKEQMDALRELRQQLNTWEDEP